MSARSFDEILILLHLTPIFFFLYCIVHCMPTCITQQGCNTHVCVFCLLIGSSESRYLRAEALFFSFVSIHMVCLCYMVCLCFLALIGFWGGGGFAGQAGCVRAEQLERQWAAGPRADDAGGLLRQPGHRQGVLSRRREGESFGRADSRGAAGWFCLLFFCYRILLYQGMFFLFFRLRSSFLVLALFVRYCFVFTFSRSFRCFCPFFSHRRPLRAAPQIIRVLAPNACGITGEHSK